MAEELVFNIKSDIGKFTKGVDKATKSTEKLTKANIGTGKAAKSASQGFSFFGRGLASVGKILGGLGIITVVAAAFTALKEAMSKNQGVMDTIANVTTTISQTFNQLINILVDTYYYVTQGSGKFEALGTILGNLKTLAIAPVELAFNGLKLAMQAIILAYYEVKDALKPGALDIHNLYKDADGNVKRIAGTGNKASKEIAKLKEDMLETKRAMSQTVMDAATAAKSIYNNFGDAVDEVADVYTRATGKLSEISIAANYESAKATTAAVKLAKFAGAEFAKLNAEKLKEAELLRNIRDQESNTYAVRIKANQELKKSLEEQQKLQSDQIKKQITAAQLLVNQNANDENQLALMEAKNLQLELEETITGQLSEQKTNAVGLERELLETQRTLRVENLEGMERELAELQITYDEKVEMARKANEGITELTKQFEAEQIRIKKEGADKDKAIEKSKKDMQFDMANQGLQIIANAAGEGTALAKAAAIAQATISGVQGVQNAFTSANANIGATAGSFGAYPVTMAALAGTFAAMNIAKIASGGGGGATPPSTPPPTVQTPAPQMMSGNFDISGGVAPEPIKAFVLTDEMSNSQNQLANIRRRATI